MKTLNVLTLILSIIILILLALYLPKITGNLTYYEDKNTIIIDSSDQETNKTGTWEHSEFLLLKFKTAYYGNGYFISKNRDEVISFFFKPKTTGTYNLYSFWPAAETNSAKVPHTVYHKYGKTTVYANEQINGTRWNFLGIFADPQYIEINNAQDGDVIVDAIKLEKCAPNCINKKCGEDSCLGVCGECNDDETCEKGECITKQESVNQPTNQETQGNQTTYQEATNPPEKQTPTNYLWMILLIIIIALLIIIFFFYKFKQKDYKSKSIKKFIKSSQHHLL